MQTIRETWMPEAKLFNAPFLQPPDGVTWNTVYSERQRRGTTQAMAFLDKLSIATDPNRRINSVTVSNNNWSSETGIILTALTIETLKQ